MLKAAETALRQLRRPEDVARARGKSIRDVLPYKAPVEEDETVVASAPTEEPSIVAEEVTGDGESEADAGS
jgi:hypothetical protein